MHIARQVLIYRYSCQRAKAHICCFRFFNAVLQMIPYMEIFYSGINFDGWEADWTISCIAQALCNEAYILLLCLDAFLLSASAKYRI